MVRAVRLTKKLVQDLSDDEKVFSAEDTPEESESSSSSSDSEAERRRNKRKKKAKKPVKKKRKKSYSDSSDVDDPDSDSSEDVKKSKKKKRKKSNTKYYSSSDDSAKEDSDKDEKKRSKEDEEKARIEKLKASKLKIVPITDEELKEKYRYKKHKCALSSLPTKRAISGQELCRPGRPAELAVDKVKLHYVVHYIYRGTWDHIVPEEGDKEGKIDSYVCNACSNKRFKNYLDKKEYPGRGSALCHIATDHGRLLHAMLNDPDVDMTKEIEALAKYDKHFNETYRAFLDHDDNSFALGDDEVITIKESLVWKIYNAKCKEEAKNGNKPPVPKNDAAPPQTEAQIKALQAIMARPKPKKFTCPKENCDYKGTEDPQAFRLHFFMHFKEKWFDRFENLTKGDKCYYCDLCPTKKPIKGATDEGAKTATICHLAIQHHELRIHMEKDSSLSKDFILDVYYDIDLKKAQNAGVAIPAKPPQINNGNSTNDTPKPATPTTQKKTDQKVTGSDKKRKKPGPKSKTRPPSSEEEEQNNEDEIPDFSDNDKKSKDSDDEVVKPRTNKNYIRKRPKINLTMEDLEANSEDEDKNWDKSPDSTKTRSRNGKTPQAGGAKKRVMPRRQAARAAKQKPDEFSDEEESD